MPSKVASVTITSEPAMALSNPPESAMGGGVISVKMARVSPPIPSRTVSIRIQISQKRPKAIAAMDSTKATTLTILRYLCLARRDACRETASLMKSSLLAFATD